MQSADQTGYPETEADDVAGTDRVSPEGEPGLERPRRLRRGAEWWRLRREMKRTRRAQREAEGLVEESRAEIREKVSQMEQPAERGRRGRG
jgi:hypothetical protein